MATRVTLPPLEAAAATDETSAGSNVVPVAKVQLLNDRGDRQAEAEWLSAAARPGVVVLLSTSEEPFTIVTAHAGARTMRTAGLSPSQGIELMLQVTELLTELHRDGFTHGKLTVDHILIGRGGPVLCSPDGTITTPDVDLEGLARCMRELGRQWDETKATCPWRASWDDLARRLEEATDPSASAVRVTHALRRMSGANESPATPTHARSHRPKGLVAAAGLAAIAIGGIALVPTNEGGGATGPRFVADGATYAIGNEGDDVAYLEQPCDEAAPVVSLRPATGEIWAFRVIDDGARSEPIAVVPGATEIRSEQRTQGERNCHVAVARGPAGATEVDTAALMFDTATGQGPAEGD